MEKKTLPAVSAHQTELRAEMNAIVAEREVVMVPFSEGEPIMPRMLTVAEAQAHFPKLIDDVCNGEEVVIARGSAPIIKLMPVASLPKQEETVQMRRRNAIEEFKTLRKRLKIHSMSMEDIISARDEGRP